MKISLHHPTHGYFCGMGNTIKEATKKCLAKIAKTLVTKKMSKKEIKQELKYATSLIKDKLTR